MTDRLVFASIVGLATVSTILLAIVLRRSRRSRLERHRRLDDRLATAHTEARTHLEQPPRVRDVVVVDRTPDGEPVVVPIVRVDLGSTAAPSMDLVFEYVASVLEAIHPECRDDHIRHYDVQFSFGPDGLLAPRLCQRVSITPVLADRLCDDADYRAFDLKRDVERADDGDSDGAPVLWGECKTYDEEAAAVSAGSSGGPTLSE